MWLTPASGQVKRDSGHRAAKTALVWVGGKKQNPYRSICDQQRSAKADVSCEVFTGPSLGATSNGLSVSLLCEVVRSRYFTDSSLVSA